MCHLLQIMWKDGLPKDGRTTTGKMHKKIGVSMFRPLIIKETGSELCDVPFPCFSTQAVHIEVTNSLDTYSFLFSIPRFITKHFLGKNISFPTNLTLSRTTTHGPLTPC